MRCGDRLLVFDAGSGMPYLGRAMAEEAPQRIDILFSHCHYDHIEGLPFFGPLHNSGNEVHVWSGHLDGHLSTADMIHNYMREPYFPVGPACFSAAMHYHDLVPGDRLDLGDGISVDSIKLKHPGGAVAYRVAYGGHSAVYMTDVEHQPGRLNDALVKFARGCDIFIYDAMYTDDNFAPHAGYGHSTWQQGARLADAAGVVDYVGFHHNPDATDADLAERELKLKRLRPGSRLAREGLTMVPRRKKGK